MAVDGLLSTGDAILLSKMVGAQGREVIVRVQVVEGEDEVDKRLAAAGAMRWMT